MLCHHSVAYRTSNGGLDKGGRGEVRVKVNCSVRVGWGVSESHVGIVSRQGQPSRHCQSVQRERVVSSHHCRRSSGKGIVMLVVLGS